MQASYWTAVIFYSVVPLSAVDMTREVSLVYLDLTEEAAALRLYQQCLSNDLNPKLPSEHHLGP